jgi:hypothetical protein
MGLAPPLFVCVTVASLGSQAARARASSGVSLGYIAFGLHRSRSDDLMLVDPRGHAVPVAGGRIVDFGWSPDGSRIVFSRIDGPSNTLPASLYLVKGLGTSRLPLLTDNRQVN